MSGQLRVAIAAGYAVLLAVNGIFGSGAFGVPIGPCSSSCAANSGATAWQYKFEKRLPNGYVSPPVTQAW